MFHSPVRSLSRGLKSLFFDALGRGFSSIARGERPRSLAVLGTRLTTQTKPPEGGSIRHRRGETSWL